MTTTTLVWNANGDGLGLNLDGYDRFQVRVNRFALASDINGIATAIGTISIQVANNVNTPSTSSFTRTLDTISNPTNLSFFLTEFSDPTVFNNPIQEIRLVLTGNQNGLLFILEDIIITTPEPSLALGYIVLAATGGIATGLRKRK